MNDNPMSLGEWTVRDAISRGESIQLPELEPTIIDGSKLIPTVFGETNDVPSVWIGLVSETELKFRKKLLEYLLVTARMAEDSGNDELAWRIWQVYGRLESLWEGKWWSR